MNCRARSGFFEDGEFAALLLELPADVRDLVKFLRATGWRRDEGRLLMWSSADTRGGVIRLEEARSKSGVPRVFPYGLAPMLKALFRARWAVRRVLYVFHRNGQPLFRRAGVSEGEIMKLCGWHTRSMFDRYNIIDEADLPAAVAKRFSNGKQTANIEPSTAPQDSVTSSRTES
jgi:hypothetical protein